MEGMKSTMCLLLIVEDMVAITRFICKRVSLSKSSVYSTRYSGLSF